MDTSEQYITMCEKAVEIQKLWKPKAWDYCFCKTENEVVVLSGYYTDGGYYGHGVPKDADDEWNREGFYSSGSCDQISRLDFKSYHTFLPRQDQLQDIFDLDTDDLESIFHCWYGDMVAENKKYVNKSFEQLWLAFVMKEKFDNKWAVKNE